MSFLFRRSSFSPGTILSIISFDLLTQKLFGCKENFLESWWLRFFLTFILRFRNANSSRTEQSSEVIWILICTKIVLYQPEVNYHRNQRGCRYHGSPATFSASRFRVSSQFACGSVFPSPFFGTRSLERFGTMEHAESEGVGTTGTNHKLRLIGNYFFSASTLLFALGTK